MAKTKSKKKLKLNVVKKEAKYLKSKMMRSRLIGIITCIFALIAISVFFFKLINEWLCIIVLTYCLGNIFSANSFIQDIKVGNPWQRLNGIISIIFYVLTVGLIVYAFVTKNLTLQF